MTARPGGPPRAEPATAPPLVHFTPRAGWMNDPNGLIHWRGRYHLFFQHNPVGADATRTGWADAFDGIGWGHASSTDLLTWTEHPMALRAGLPDSDYDRDGCFSGCAVVSGEEVQLLYTGVRDEMQLPCLARAVDDGLLAFRKHAGNPVIDRPDGATAFRDHTVSRIGDRWFQLIGGGDRDRGGCVYAFDSVDLIHWQARGIALDATSCEIPGVIWECPDLFFIDGRAVMTISVWGSTPTELGPGHIVWWAVGDLDDNRFHPVRTGILDVGDRFYAPQSFWAPDGRRLMFGWLRTQLDPDGHGLPWAGTMSLPRQLTLRDDVLRVAAADEVALLRTDAALHPTGTTGGSTHIALPAPRATEVLIPEQFHVRAITIAGGDADDAVTLQGSDLPAADDADAGELRLIVDAGVIEAFRNGKAACWSHLGLTEVSHLTIDCHGASSPGAAVTTYRLVPGGLRRERTDGVESVAE